MKDRFKFGACIEDYGIYLGPKVQHWTYDSINCYLRNCACKDCFYEKFFSGSAQKCKMKYTVRELVRVLGKPSDELIEEIYNEKFKG